MKKLIRITTVPISLEKLLENQASFFKSYYEVTLVSAQKDQFGVVAKDQGVAFFPLEITRKITPLQDFRSLIKLVRFLLGFLLVFLSSFGAVTPVLHPSGIWRVQLCPAAVSVRHTQHLACTILENINR